MEYHLTVHLKYSILDLIIWVFIVLDSHYAIDIDVFFLFLS